MKGIVTFTVETCSIDETTKAKLDDVVTKLGLRTTLPETEGGTLHLPSGTYAAIIQIEDQMAQMKGYYRSLVDAARKLSIKGKYFVVVSQKPALVCGKL